jgi:hypothetical protein
MIGDVRWADQMPMRMAVMLNTLADGQSVD